MGIRAFAKEYRPPICSIYGFVRFADEIVDTFHQHNKKELLDQFRKDTYEAIEIGISLNPVLHAFQKVVNDYNIKIELIDAFLDSMEMDLDFQNYTDDLYDTYIYGSAEVVGLMCLCIFCEGDEERYEKLKEPARRLGAAFQKVNFLRDMRSDYDERGRVYFPGVDFNTFTDKDKAIIEQDILKDFEVAYNGIIQLPKSVRLGVYLAYIFYLKLFKKIRKAPATLVQKERIRINNWKKVFLLFFTTVKLRLNLL